MKGSDIIFNLKKIGYFVKINKFDNMSDFYTYQEILYDFKKRKILYHELEHNHNLNLYCCCSKDQAPIRLSETYSFEFPHGHAHDEECIAFLQRLYYLSSKRTSLPFTSSLSSLPVRFRWKKSSRSSSEYISQLSFSNLSNDRLSLSNFISIINARVFQAISKQLNTNQISDYLSTKEFISEIAFELGKYTLFDPNGETIILTESYLTKYNNQLETISFFYGKVLSINTKYSSKVYLSCYGLNGKISLIISKERWNTLSQYIIAELDLWISCFVLTKQVSSYEKGQYDSITHTFYNTGIRKDKIENNIKSCVIFNTNAYGLLCFSAKEKEISDTLCIARQPFYKPYITVPHHDSLPLLIVPNMGGDDYIISF